MMIDDFWGEGEWRNFYEEMKRVFPEREPVELDRRATRSSARSFP